MSGSILTSNGSTLERSHRPRTRIHPEPTPAQAASVRFIGLAQKIQQALSVVSIIVAKMMPSAVPAHSPARRQSRKLLLIDLKLGFDQGEVGARLIRVAT